MTADDPVCLCAGTPAEGETDLGRLFADVMTEALALPVTLKRPGDVAAPSAAPDEPVPEGVMPPPVRPPSPPAHDVVIVLPEFLYDAVRPRPPTARITYCYLDDHRLRPMTERARKAAYGNWVGKLLGDPHFSYRVAVAEEGDTQ
jgi:hypothetical protein